MITLEHAKADLRVRHSHDDVLILRLVDAATAECLRFMNRDEPPRVYEDEEDEVGEVPADVKAAACLLVQAGYDRMRPDEVALRRQRAEQLCMPYRIEVGV